MRLTAGRSALVIAALAQLLALSAASRTRVVSGDLTTFNAPSRDNGAGDAVHALIDDVPPSADGAPPDPEAQTSAPPMGSTAAAPETQNDIPPAEGTSSDPQAQDGTRTAEASPEADPYVGTGQQSAFDRPPYESDPREGDAKRVKSGQPPRFPNNQYAATRHRQLSAALPCLQWSVVAFNRDSLTSSVVHNPSAFPRTCPSFSGGGMAIETSAYNPRVELYVFWDATNRPEPSYDTQKALRDAIAACAYIHDPNTSAAAAVQCAERYFAGMNIIVSASRPELIGFTRAETLGRSLVWGWITVGLPHGEQQLFAAGLRHH